MPDGCLRIKTSALLLRPRVKMGGKSKHEESVEGTRRSFGGIMKKLIVAPLVYLAALVGEIFIQTASALVWVLLGPRRQEIFLDGVVTAAIDTATERFRKVESVSVERLETFEYFWACSLGEEKAKEMMTEIERRLERAK